MITLILSFLFYFTSGILMVNAINYGRERKLNLYKKEFYIPFIYSTLSLIIASIAMDAFKAFILKCFGI
jgi:hypothetical protein